jgi:hypothetical protein
MEGENVAGSGVRAAPDGHELRPTTRLGAIASGSASAVDWRRECEIAGVEDAPLVGVAIR